MARKWQVLTVVKINSLTKRGYYGDGGNLYLRVTHRGVKLWAFRWKRDGRVHEAGLGGYPEVSLKQARERAAECRDWLFRGIDPSHALRARRSGGATEITFREVAERYIEAHTPGWRNAKHAAQWRSTLATFVYPVIGDLPVPAVDVHHVIRILSPIWTSKTETATRVRQRIEAVLDAAKAQGYRSGENPARWRGHLAKLLPPPARVKRVEHHPALPYAELPAFMAALAQQPGVAALALRFTILTAARTGEVIGMRWQEIEGDAWTVPGDRMKAGKEHRVPLSAPARAILAELPRVSDFVLPGARPMRPLSSAAMTATLRRMGRSDITVHGFRSTFRDWTGDCTSFPREVAEAALAHVLSDKTEAAYARGDLFKKRRELMDSWCEYSVSLQGQM